MRRALIVSFGGLWLLACARDRDPYLAEIETWRAQRLNALTAEDGWLTLAGLYWLKVGTNRIGTESGLEIVLPAGSAPSAVGVMTVEEGGGLSFEASPGVPVTLDGKLVTKTSMRADDAGPPTTLKLDRLTFYVIRRQGRYGVRLKDNASLVRRQLKGIECYPIDRAWRVEARFELYDQPHTVTFATALGGNDTATSPGVAIFALAGRELRLEATQDPGAEELSFVFGDLTNGQETYGGGRFLDTPLAKDGILVLDFNKAYNPPCVFTPYATCPLPSRDNKLPVRVTAGEKAAGLH